MDNRIPRIVKCAATWMYRPAKTTPEVEEQEDATEQDSGFTYPDEEIDSREELWQKRRPCQKDPNANNQDAARGPRQASPECLNQGWHESSGRSPAVKGRVRGRLQPDYTTC